MELGQLLAAMVKEGGSDLHLRVGAPPKARMHGSLQDLSKDRLTPAHIKSYIGTILKPEEVKKLVAHCDIDVLYVDRRSGRFRTNIFKHSGNYGLVMRHIPTEIPSFEKFGFPESIRKLAEEERGIVLVTGTTGSGKSTTLAAMINHINETKGVNILTVEDPVEFFHPSKKALISQRSLGQDVPSFGHALKYALRQDPDVILIGEMRDFETISAAVEAAETGHLVFSTLHTTNCSQTVDRILNTYPGDMIEQIRQQLSLNLKGVISQRLIKTRDGKGRVAAQEILISTPRVRKLLLEGAVGGLYKVMEEGELEGMQSFNQVLCKLFAEGKITLEGAIDAASRPDELMLKIKMEGLG